MDYNLSIFLTVFLLICNSFEYWTKNEFEFTDDDPEFYCQYSNAVCDMIPSSVFPRQYHTSIIYETWTTEDVNNLCPGYYCGPYCDSTDTSCYVTLNPTDLTEGGRGDLPEPGGETTGLDATHSNCPDECCDESNENCFRTLDNTGYPVVADEEIMLVFGGLTYRHLTYDGELLFWNCEEEMDNNDDEIEPLHKGCGEQPLNDLWRYHIQSNTWTYIKADYNQQLYSSWKAPSARYGHASVYIEQYEVDRYTNQNVLRKYMYMYGGFSFDCIDACYDLWRYEIPWAVQRYYPEPSFEGVWWNRGNHWTLLTNDSSNSPGPRFKHSMIVDYDMTMIFLFGGVSFTEDSNSQTMNDLWKYYIEQDKWEEVKSKGIHTISKIVRQWDGTSVTKTVQPKEKNDDDNVEYEYIADCNEECEVPKGRAGMSTTLIGNPPVYIIMFGGYTQNETSEKYEYLNDMWVFSIYSYKWHQVFPNSDLPDAREGATFATISIDRLAVMFGGSYADTVFSELWQYSLYTNMWMKLEGDFGSDEPAGTKHHTMVVYSGGFILYGGMHWDSTDLELSDELENQKSLYLDECSELLKTYGLDISDIGTSAQEQAYIDSGYNSCFDIDTPFQKIERRPYYSTNVYIFNTNTCQDDCNGRGTCSFGRCTCLKNYYGSACEYLKCYNSICFYDIDTIDPAECFHCSGHGECVNGICECDEGYVGDDCRIKDCPNNCSNTETTTVGECIVQFPISQCKCYEETRRGGDFCQKVFCLNECSNNGECTDGVCTCKELYYGEDCSVFVFPTQKAVNLSLNLVIVVVGILGVL